MRRLLVTALALWLGACSAPQPAATAPAAQGPVHAPGSPEETAAEIYWRAMDYLDGRGMPRDDAKGLALLQSAADKGLADAQFMLGLLYDTGRAVNEDPAAAAAWYAKAAAQKHPEAQFLLGLDYYRGRGVRRNDAQAVKLFGAAAARNAAAAYHLGVAYMLGRGVAANDAAALKWLQQSADRHYPEAQYLVGLIYTNGRGVPRDLAWAARWYGKAAEQGLVRAQYMLGLDLVTGLGLPQDLAEGYRWLTLAAEHGDQEAARLRTSVEDKLEKSDRSAAVTWARSWKPPEVRPFADAPTIRYVQVALARLGYDIGSPDGVLGSRTRDAIAAYRAKSEAGSGEQITADLLDSLRLALTQAGKP
ncbi:MAG TPA: peptidoglycan-binding protein [Candidatus Sulfotelmatobacter sp.]|nr:peptidoglycan-binding protein [Candidatus Sulfotelmatobacter sp.]